MKRILAVALLLTGVTAQAQDLNVNLTKRFGFGAGLGFAVPIFDNEFAQEAGADWMYDLKARYNMTDASGLQFAFTKYRWDDTDIDANVYDLMYLRRTNPNGRVSPIWGIGAGVANLSAVDPEDNMKLALRAKGGVEYAFTEDLFLTASIDYQYINQMIGESGSLPTGEIHALVPQANITYFFGGAPAAVAAATGAVDENASEALITEVEINFDTNSAQLEEDQKSDLQDLVKYMEENPGSKVEIQGYADAVGPNEFNNQLSNERADSVADYLIDEGIPPERLDINAFGENEPVASNEDPSGRAANRRVRAIITL